MHRLRLRIRAVAAGVVLLCGGLWQACAAEGGGLRYFGDNPHRALVEAKVQHKMLLVEFYAAWNHRSRWMSERVLGDTSLRALIEDHFLVVRVDTQTQEGGALAQLYEVSGYPTLVLFSSEGDVLDKIDKTLDREDFQQRIEALLLVTGEGADRSGRSGYSGHAGRELELVYAAAQAGDRHTANLLAARYLASQAEQQVISRAVWPLFRHTIVTGYGSAAFGYLLDHAAAFRREVGAGQVDRVIERALLDGMMPYVVGTALYDAAAVGQMVGVAEREQLVGTAAALRPLAAASAARDQRRWAEYVRWIGVSLDRVPVSMQFSLLVALEPVAAADRDAESGARQAARRLVTQALARERAYSEAALLGDLLERLK